MRMQGRRKKLRLEDRRFYESRTAELAELEIEEEEEILATELKLAMGRPRMAASAVYLFLMIRGGCVATFKNQQESDWLGRPGSVLCSHFEQLVDELNLLPNIRTAHPPRLTLPDHVNCLISLDRSPCRVKFTKALLGLHASFDRSMILLQDVVQVLNRPVTATVSQDSFLLHS